MSSATKTVAKLAGCTALAGALLAGVLFPVVGGFGYASNQAVSTVDNVSAELAKGVVPGVSTMVDAAGNPIAWLYEQRRFEVPSDQISNEMKLAIVLRRGQTFRRPPRRGLAGHTPSVPDQHHQRTGRTGRLDTQPAVREELSTSGAGHHRRRTPSCHRNDTRAQDPRDRMALTLDRQLTKDEILTRYLNLVPFGNASFGIQDAARTYFGIDASDLSAMQAAMLAGMVQSSSALNRTRTWTASPHAETSFSTR